MIKKTNTNRIEQTFIELKKKNKKALIPFITAGYPDYDSFINLFFTLQNAGADIIEIGMPFSDPIADGQIIQNSSKVSLEKGFNTALLISSIKQIRQIQIRQKLQTPIAVMTYFNIVYKYGVGKFLEELVDAGADGIIIPDLPFEEFLKYKNIFINSGLANIMLATLSTDKPRLKQILKYCSGFLYFVLLKGVTGSKGEIQRKTIDMLLSIKEQTELPVSVGFGISEPAQVKLIKNYCDGIIIGSKIISLINKDDSNFVQIVEFIKKIKNKL